VVAGQGYDCASALCAVCGPAYAYRCVHQEPEVQRCATYAFACIQEDCLMSWMMCLNVRQSDPYSGVWGRVKDSGDV
jgi:hypothetical protein